MEKLQYLLWKQPQASAGAFRKQLLDDLAPALLARGVLGLRLCVADEDVAAAAGLRQEKLCPAADALVSLWVDKGQEREGLEANLAACCERFCGFLVRESAPLVHDQQRGQRMDGWTQVVFLERPPAQSPEDWLEVWQGSHTPVVIETQSTFAYRQNLVLQPLSGNAPPIDAIVEESFPAAAMDSPYAFYDADSDEQLRQRVEAMIESCARFIDFERITVIPMSDYLLKDVDASA
jgi:hypothetical protein